jgi:hypothetical protein
MEHEESGNFNFTLLSPASPAWQCFHNSQSSRMKPTQIPHKNFKEVGQEEDKDPTISLTKSLDKPQNCLASHYSFSKLPQLWVLLPMNSRAYCLPNLMTTLITMNPIAMRTAHETPQTFIIFLISSLHCPSTLSNLREKAMAHRKETQSSTRRFKLQQGHSSLTTTNDRLPYFKI